MKILHFIERSIIVGPTVMMTVIIIISTKYMVFIIMKIIGRDTDGLFNLQAMMEFPGIFLIVFIGRELSWTFEDYLKKNDIHAGINFPGAILAIK